MESVAGPEEGRSVPAPQQPLAAAVGASVLPEASLPSVLGSDYAQADSLEDSWMQTVGPQGRGLGVAPASLPAPRSRRRVPDPKPGPPRVFKFVFWPRPVQGGAPPTVPGVPGAAAELT